MARHKSSLPAHRDQGSAGWLSVIVTGVVVLVWAMLAVLILAPQGDFWDGRILDVLARHGQFEALWQWFSESRWIIQFGVMWLFHHAAEITGADIRLISRLAILVSLAGFAYEAGRFARNYLGTGAIDARIVTILVLLFPAWHVLVSTIMVIHIACAWLVLLGFRLWTTGRWITALPILLFSLQLNSNFLFLLVLFWVRLMLIRQHRQLSRFEIGEAVAVSLGLVMLFQLVQWLLPFSGQFATYNKIELPQSLSDLSLLGARILVFLPPSLRWLPHVVGLILFVLVADRILRKNAPANVLEGFLVRLCAVSLLIGGATLPYILVGKGDVWIPLDWADRQTVLAAFPVALLVILLAQTAANRVNFPAVGPIVGLVVSLAFAQQLWLGFQAKYVILAEDIRTKAALAAIEAPPPAGTVILIEPARRTPLLRSYEAAWVYRSAWGQNDWAGVVAHPQLLGAIDTHRETLIRLRDQPLWQEAILMEGINPACWSELTIESDPISLRQARRWVLSNAPLPLAHVSAMSTRCSEDGSVPPRPQPPG